MHRICCSVVATLLLFGTLTNALNYCPPDWVESKAACFYYNPTALNYSDADAACGALVPGARLATPFDLDISSFLPTLRATPWLNAWLGMRFVYVNATSSYVTSLMDAVPIYTIPWASSQPSATGNDFCTAVLGSSTSWMTAPCNTTLPSFCMFYTNVSQMAPELFAPLNRLYGASDWFGSSPRSQIQDGTVYNVPLTTGPNQKTDSAIQLYSDVKSYVALANPSNLTLNVTGLNFYRKSFYFMFYVYLTSDSVGPIIQYRFNETHYGFNIWSYGNGSLLIDLVQSTPSGPVPTQSSQVFVQSGCVPLNTWAFVTVAYMYDSTGYMWVYQGTTQCVQTAIGSIDVEMSRDLDIGHRQMQTPSSDIFTTLKMSCILSGSAAPISPFAIGEMMIWCQQALLETTMDRTMAKRTVVSFTREGDLVGLWPLNDFYREREAAGRIFFSTVANMTFGLGPNGKANGSLIFDGITNFASLNAQPNQGQLGAAFNFLRRSFSVSTYAFVKDPAKDGGPLASFAYDSGISQQTTVIYVSSANVRVVMPLLGGKTAWTDATFNGCLTLGKWQYLSVVYNYASGSLSVYVDAGLCSTQNVGQASIEAHTNIVVGRLVSLSSTSYFKGRLSCFSVYSAAITTGDMSSAMQSCLGVLASGQTYRGSLYKPQHLRLFMPLGRNYGLNDVSGNNMHGTARGRLVTSTGPLGHPFSATKFTNEPNSAIDIQNVVREKPYAISTNDSVTYMGYVHLWPGRDGNLPNNMPNTIFEHWDVASETAGSGFSFMFYTMYHAFYRVMNKGSYQKYNYVFLNNTNTASWHWFVVRYSRVTRKISVSLDGVVYADDLFGWQWINTFSTLTIGNRWSDSLRFSGKLACFMIYDTDIRDSEARLAQDMCHAAIAASHGPAMDTAQCSYTSGGWEYSGTISWTKTGRVCKPWTCQSNYTDSTMFPEQNISLAGSYCRNPEPLSSSRSKPWCYTVDPSTPWEYCDVPRCSPTLNWPFHLGKYLLGYWPLSTSFGATDISGHDAHAGFISSTATWANGPSGLSNTAAIFGSSDKSFAMVENHPYNNVADLLDMGAKGGWLNGGFSYTIMAMYTNSLTGNGMIWSWEGNNGDGGVYGFQISYVAGGIVRVAFADYRNTGGRVLSCGGLVTGNWYQLTVTYDRILWRVSLYIDAGVCAYSTISGTPFQEGLYTYSGGFKFGRSYDSIGSSIPISCAQVYATLLTTVDIVALKSKCFDIIGGGHDDVLFDPGKPTALFPMAAQTGGLNTRNLNHARYSMTDIVPGATGLTQGAMSFIGNNNQYFWAAQDYALNLDVCAQTRSYTMSAYARVQANGMIMAFHTKSSSLMDDATQLGIGNQMYVINTVSNMFGGSFTSFDTQIVPSFDRFGSSIGCSSVYPRWTHITMSYDFPSDTFYMYYNGSMQTRTRTTPYTVNATQLANRKVYCQTSGSLNIGRLPVMPLTAPLNSPGILSLGLSISPQPFVGSVYCSQLYSRGLQTEQAVRRSMRYCSHPDFIGCYPVRSTGSTDFIFNPGFWKSESLTVATCRTQCGIANYSFAGLQNGSVCMCSNKFGSDGPEMPERCNATCTGNTNDWCGGPKAFSVYRSIATRRTVAPAIKSVDYANCATGWTMRGLYCYRVFTTKANMANAKFSCYSYGAQLATVVDWDENNFIGDIAPPMNAGDFICLGSTATGQYKSVSLDGQPNFYNNLTNSFTVDNPNNWGCFLFRDRTWIPQNPNSAFAYACKKSIAPFSNGWEPTCLPGWRRFNQDCFMFNKDLLPYGAAKQICSGYSSGAYNVSLLKVTSQALFEFALNVTDWQRPFWLGLRFSSNSNAFLWESDGSLLSASSFAPWAGDDTFDPTARTCAYADSRSQYFWRTAECDGSRRLASVCHYNLGNSGFSSGLAFIGLGNNRILNAQISATGINTSTSTSPYQVRLPSDSAWCYAATDIPNGKLTIDLRETYNLVEIWMRGNPQTTSEAVTGGTLEYSNDGGVTWTYLTYTTLYYHDGTGGAPWQTLNSNNLNTSLPMAVDGTRVSRLSLPPLFQANKLRLTPTSYSGRPCLQLDFVYKQNASQPLRKLDLAFKPIRFELTRTAGTVRYDANVYVQGDRTQTLAYTERVVGSEYLYSARTVGWQKVLFTGIDAEGATHELSYELTTGTRVIGIALNRCPSAVAINNYAPCEVRVIGGSDFDVTTDYVFDLQGPRRLKAGRIDVGSTVPPTGSVTVSDQSGYVYMMPNQLVRSNGTAYAIEAVLTAPGYVTIQLYRPYCSTPGFVFCVVCHCCLDMNFGNQSCVRQRPFDAYSCGNGTCGIGNNQTVKNNFFTSLPVDYQWASEWRKYFSAPGNQVLYLDDNEITELTMGAVVGYYANSSDSGRIQTWTSNTIKEFAFQDTAASTFTSRQTTGFTLLKTATYLGTSSTMHMIKLITVKSVGIGFGRKWQGVSDGVHTVTITVRDRVVPDNTLNFTYDLTVQYPCSGFALNFPSAGLGATLLPFTIPAHSGSQCSYQIDFGDESTPTLFNYLTRNNTFYHAFRLAGTYTVTLTSWNMISNSSTSSAITIMYPIARMSAHYANPPVTEMNAYSTVAVTYVQGNSIVTTYDLDVNGTSGSASNSTFTPCPNGWTPGVSTLGVDACYRFFSTPALSYERAEFYCASFGASLVSVASNAELDYVKTVILSNIALTGGDVSKGAWTGYSLLKDGFGFWVTQEDKRVLPLQFWHDVSNSYPTPTGGLCGAYDYNNRRIQNDNCSLAKPFVCKRETAVDSYCGPSSSWTLDPVSNRCFRAFTTPSPAITAAYGCRQVGGQLATPDNQRVFNFIYNNIIATTSKLLNYYIGMWRLDGADLRVFDGWSDYAPTFTNFGTYSTDNCAYILGSTGFYKVVACAEMAGYICEKPIYGNKPTRYAVRTASRRYIISRQLPASCPPDWVLNNQTSTCFRLITTKPSNWTVAETDCFTRFNAHLATINTAADQSFFVSNVIGSAGTDVWLGLAEVNLDSNWLWRDGSSTSGINKPWGSLQPRSSYLGYAYYMANTQYWYEAIGTESKAYACSKPATLGVRTWAGTCATGYNEFSGRCFRFSPTPQDHATALQTCKNEGGGLATIRSNSDLVFLRGIIPLNIDDVHIGLKFTTTWVWDSDVRGRAPNTVYKGLWAPNPGTASGCGKLSRPNSFSTISTDCTSSYAFICEQPAAVCPPQWTVWAGSCYRAFNTTLRIQPTIQPVDYDTARLACQTKESLPITPVNQEELNWAVNLAGGSSKTFALGYRRLATSMFYTDMWGRSTAFLTGFAGSAPTTGNAEAYYSASSIGYTSDLPTDASVCIMPNKLTSDHCIRECLNTPDFACKSFMYDGVSCQFMNLVPSENYAGLRESFSTVDLYTIKDDICKSDMLVDAAGAYRVTNSSVNLLQGIKFGSNGFVAENGNDSVKVEFDNLIWLTSLVLGKRADANEYLMTFKLQYSFDKSYWSTFQYPLGYDFVFTANSDDQPTKFVQLPKAILLRSFIIVPVTYFTLPSFRMKLIACHGAILNDYVEYPYTASGTYSVMARADSPINSISLAVPELINVQSRLYLTSITTPKLPISFGDYASIPFLYSEFGSSSFPTANASFNGLPLSNTTLDPFTKRGVIVVDPPSYSSVGLYKVTLTLDNLLSDPLDASTMVWVDYNVRNLTVTTNASDLHGCLQGDIIQLNVTMLNCTRCNVTVTYGSADAIPQAFAMSYDYIVEGVPLAEVPAVRYPKKGGYFITVTAVNYLMDPKMVVYDLYVQLPPYPNTFSYAVSSPIAIPYQGFGVANFVFFYTGPVADWPSNVSMYIDFKDGSNFTQLFDATNLPAGIPNAVNHPMGNVSHFYYNAGKYSPYMEVFNRIGRVNGTVSVVVEQEIYGLTVTPSVRYVMFGDTVTLTVSALWGTRYTWRVGVRYPDRSLLLSDYYNASVQTSVPWTFNQKGNFDLIVEAYNLVSNITNLTMSDQVIVQTIVHPNGYKITALPSIGTYVFEKDSVTGTGTATTKYILWINTDVVGASDPYYLIYYGDEASVNASRDTTIRNSAMCLPELGDMKDGSWVRCLEFTKIYDTANTFEASITVKNLASSRVFRTLFTVYVSIPKLDIEVLYADSDVNPRWLPGYPKLNVDGKKYYFFEMGKTVNITAKAIMGGGLRYCFFTKGIEGNLTDCSGPWRSSPASVTWKFNYDTPCGALFDVGTCNVEIGVTASSPVDTKTTTVSIFFQKRSQNLRLIQNGPAAENTSYPIYLVYDRLGTDVCIEVDYGTDFVETGRNRITLYGSEYLCSDYYTREQMNNHRPTPPSYVTSSSYYIPMNYYRKGQYIVSVKVRNFIETLSAETNQALMTPLTVTKGPCSYPKLFLPATATQMFKKDELQLPGQILMNCSFTTLMSLNWTISYSTDRNSWKDVGADYLPRTTLFQQFDGVINMTSPFDKSITFPAATLKYGFYKFIMSALMVEEPSLNSTLSYIIEVIKSDLIVSITPPGARRDLVYGDPIKANAFQMASDPDLGDVGMSNKENINVYYFCKRDCEGSWPTFTTRQMAMDFIDNPEEYPNKYKSFSWKTCTTDDEDLKLDSYEVNGCFTGGMHKRRSDEDRSLRLGFPSLNVASFTRKGPVEMCEGGFGNLTNGVCIVELSNIDENVTLTIDSSYQFENQTYNVMAIVVKDTRVAIVKQSYRLERGAAPQVLIKPVANCIYPHATQYLKYNPMARGGFKAQVVGKGSGRRFTYNWQIIKVPKNVSIGDVTENFDAALSNFTWGYEKWQNYSSTGRTSSDLALSANMFKPEHYGSYFVVYVSVLRSGNPRPGVAALAFYVNTPPDASNVSCSSNHESGTAMYTMFTFNCLGFKSANGPITKYSFSMQACSYCSEVVLTSTLGAPSLMAGIKLSPGYAEENFYVTIYIEATDSFDSTARAKFQVRVIPKADVTDILTLASSYNQSVAIMKPEDVCQNMYTFGSLISVVVLEPKYETNASAYARMSEAERAAEDARSNQDKIRFDMEWQSLMNSRYNGATWLYGAVIKRGIKRDVNSIKTCCSGVSGITNVAWQSAENRTLQIVLSVVNNLTDILVILKHSGNQDQNRVEETSAACFAALGKVAEALEENAKKVKKIEDDKKNNSRSGENNARKKRATDPTDVSPYGTIVDVQIRTALLEKIREKLYSLVLAGKVIGDTPSVIVSQGMTSNLVRNYIANLDFAVIPSGSPSDCGSFSIGDAAVMLANAIPDNINATGSDVETAKTVDVMLKSAQSLGNPYMLDDSANGLNSAVTSLVFTDSDGVEIPVHNLPFEIEMIVESKNSETPKALKSLTSNTNVLKSMPLDILPNQALFITVDRWKLPNLCMNRNVSNDDLALNLTCSSNNITTLIYESTNYSLPGLNITDEEVIFFVYAKFDESPNETSYDFTCTLPRMIFESEYMAATGLPWLNFADVLSLAVPSNLTTASTRTPTANLSTVSVSPTTSASTTPTTTTTSGTTTTRFTTTSQQSTTTTTPPQNAPLCSSLSIINVTCCNGTSVSDGNCNGNYILPTTPAPTTATVTPKEPKNCAKPSVPNPNSCFFDHRIVNVTQTAGRKLKIAVRAIPLSVVRKYLKQFSQSSSSKPTLHSYEAKNRTGYELASSGVRVGYEYYAFTTSCVFLTNNGSWNTDGCRVGELSNPGGNPSMTQCFCTHLTTFSASFNVPMNTFDPKDSAFTKLDQNPICFTFGVCIICCFITLMIWARKRDLEDEKKWGTTPLADNDPRDKYAYELTVWTGQRTNSGTSARVSFILLGDEGETTSHMLEDDERDVLQRGGIDSFLLLTPRSLGKLVQLRIWHDNSGKHPNWYFSRMQVHDLQRNRQHYFLCDRWLAIDEEDGMVERIIPVAGKKELAGFEHLFFTKSRRKLTDGHIWISVFSRPPLSKFTRCQRLTCCLSILYCTMLANIMFYGQTRDPPGSTRIDLGPFSMSLTKIFMSVVSALIVMPVNLVIAQLFRMSRHRPTKQERKLEDLRAKTIKIQEDQRKKLQTSGQAAPPEQIEVSTISNDMTGNTEKGSFGKKNRKKEKAAKKLKKPFKLPWWCIIVAYVLATCTIGVAFWAIVEFGGALGPEKAQEWLISMIISLVTDIILIQPLKIIAIVVFYALIIKSPTKDDDLEEKAALKDDEVFMHHMPTAEEIAERRKRQEEDKREYVFLPPDPEELKAAREVRMKEKQMWKIIKEIAFYVMYLYLLLMVAFSTQDDWSMQLQKQMRRVYQAGVLATPPYDISKPDEIAKYNPVLDGHDEVFDNMQQESQFFTYLERTLIPSALDGSWYNGAYSPTNDIYTNDQTLYLVGNMRIRQVRIRPDACRTAKGIRKVFTNKCLAPYSIFDEETRNFTAKWQLANDSATMFDKSGKPITMGDSRGFAYKSEIEDRGLPFQASLATYNGGGYIVDLGHKVKEAIEKVDWLKTNKWIDEQTRAVFIEFNLYSPSRNLIAISQTVVEFFPGGSIIRYPYFYVTKLDPYFGVFALVLLGFEFLTLAITIFLFVREVRLAIKYKRQYWTDGWAVLEFTHLLSCIVMAVMFIMRYAMVRYILGSNFKKTKKNSYTNFTLFITYDQLVQCFMGFVVFIAFIRMIRLLRFNRRLVLMISTLRHVRSMLVSYFVVFFTIYIAFAHMGFVAFGAKYAAYSTFVSSLESLFSMVLGVFDYPAMKDASSVIGPVFFSLFSLFISIFMMNAFVAILMVSYYEVRAGDAKMGNEHEILEFIMHRFKAFIGLAPKRATTLSIDKRFAYIDAAAHEDDIEKFTSRMDVLMTKLDQHLEKTKTQFAGMFDQRFLQRKQREIYVTD